MDQNMTQAKDIARPPNNLFAPPLFSFLFLFSSFILFSSWACVPLTVVELSCFVKETLSLLLSLQFLSHDNVAPNAGFSSHLTKYPAGATLEGIIHVGSRRSSLQM